MSKTGELKSVLSSVENAERVLLAKVFRHDAVLEEVQVVPLRRAVVLSLRGPEEPKLKKGVQSGSSMFCNNAKALKQSNT